MNLSERLTSVVNKVGRVTSSENKDSYSLVVNIRCYSVFEDWRRTQISKEEGLQDTLFLVNLIITTIRRELPGLFERAHF